MGSQVLASRLHIPAIIVLLPADHIVFQYSERRTVKARNLAADPRVVVHLESGEDVVVVRGTAEAWELLPLCLRW